MAKSKKYSDWAVIIVIALLLVATNAYWLLATQDLEDRLDNHAKAILLLDQNQ